jgi:hypothetical protein
MAPIIPILGGQYRWKFTAGDTTDRIGVFVYNTEEDNKIFYVNQYVEALTSPNDVPTHFVGLCGLPDLQRDELNPVVQAHIDSIIILDRLYICNNSIFQGRFVQWRLGMRNLFRISDDEPDVENSFIGFSDEHDSYINMEHDYHLFKMQLVKVNRLAHLHNLLF